MKYWKSRCKVHCNLYNGKCKTLDEKKEKLQEAAVALAHDYVMITPLAVIYYQSFADPALADTGIYDVSLEQWTPEATHWTE